MKLIKVFLLLIPLNVFAGLETDYQNTPLERLVPLISNITLKPFTYSPQIALTTVSLLMPLQVSKDDAFLMFKGALKASSLKAVESSNGLVTIVSIENQSFSSGDSSFKTRTFVLKHIVSKDAQKAIETLLSSVGSVSSVGDSLLVVSDDSSTLYKVSNLINKLDINIQEAIIQKIIVLNNLLPSEILGSKHLELYPYDSVGRLVVSGLESQVNTFTSQITELDQSVNTLHVRLLIATVSTGFTEEFNLIPIFSTGALSASLSSISLDTFKPSADGISILASLLSSHNDVTIHSRPFIQLTEGKEGYFHVGREIPILVSTIDQSTGQSIRNVERKNVGLSLTLNSKVRPDGLIYLNLEQTLSSISETQLVNVSDIITEDQTLKTDLLLEAGKVYAVGGLTDTRKTSNKTGIKFLPFLDSTNETESTQEILIFIEVFLNKRVQDTAKWRATARH